MSTRKSRYFEKGHKHRYTTNREVSLTSSITLRLTPQQKEQIKNVPNWQERLRSCIDSMIEDNDE
ncbi:MAG: hypothetical protein AAGG00_07990 [Cyanobacteria bacterium P01_H01_bin.150]